MFHEMPLKLYFMKYFERKVSQCILVFSHTLQLSLQKNNLKISFFRVYLLPEEALVASFIETSSLTSRSFVAQQG